jgi:hypothetical protein
MFFRPLPHPGLSPAHHTEVVADLALHEDIEAAGVAVDLQVDRAAVRRPQQGDKVHRLLLNPLLVAQAQVAARRAHFLEGAELDGAPVREHGDGRHLALGSVGLPVGLAAGLRQGDHVVGVHGLAHKDVAPGRQNGRVLVIVEARKCWNVPEKLARADRRQLDQLAVVEQHRYALGVHGRDLDAQQAVVVDVVGDDDPVDDLRRQHGLVGGAAGLVAGLLRRGRGAGAGVGVGAVARDRLNTVARRGCPVAAGGGEAGGVARVGFLAGHELRRQRRAAGEESEGQDGRQQADTGVHRGLPGG